MHETQVHGARVLDFYFFIFLFYKFLVCYNLIVQKSSFKIGTFLKLVWEMGQNVRFFFFF